jgi:hypothetical protein
MKDKVLGYGVEMFLDYLKTGELHREFCIGDQADCDAKNYLKAIPSKVELDLKVGSLLCVN